MTSAITSIEDFEKELFLASYWGSEEQALELRAAHPTFTAQHDAKIAIARKANTPVLSDSFDRPERVRDFQNGTRVRSCKKTDHGLPGTIIGAETFENVLTYLVEMDWMSGNQRVKDWCKAEELVLEEWAAPRWQLPQEVSFKDQHAIGSILTIEENGEVGEYRVTANSYVDAETAAFLEDANDVFDAQGWHSSAVLISQTRK